ncbi:MAG: RagB/SusD family nutrient uptake outer membrane protein [Cyclobacteriaceae bacterium]
MKFIYKYAFISLTFLFSCSEDFLNLAPISDRSVEGFYNTEHELNQALMGVYDGLQTTQTSVYAMLMKEQRSDNSFQQSLLYNFHSIFHFNESPENTQLFPAWSDLYESIYRCNIFLQRIEGVDFESNQVKERMKAETKVIRALLYFDLVRYFGGVPVVTQPLAISESLQYDRNSIEEVYESIISDLEAAAANLPETYPSMDVGRITSLAAKALLGKVYLTRSGYPLETGEWEEARVLFEEVINSGQFEFFTEYPAIFDIANDNGRQFVFWVQFNSDAQGEGNPIPRIQAPNNIDRNDPELGISSGGSPLSPIVSQDFINGFEEGDLRLAHTVQMEWLQNDGTMQNTPFSRKFVSGNSGPLNNWDINWPIIRYTDVLMMYAETLNEISYMPDGQAFEILNNVRERAGLDPKTPNEVPDQASFRNWVLNERRFEFAFEHQRWHDLVRTDQGLPVMKAFLSEYGLDGNVARERYIYPIPSRVIQTNPIITQNPGFQ